MKKYITSFAILAVGFGTLFAREIKLSVTPGANWKSKMEAQSAIWVEDLEGNYITTLYVTNKAGNKNWIFGPKEGRPESLPVWYHASKVAPDKSAKEDDANVQLDAVSSATQKAGINITRNIPDSDCVIKAEFNTSFDYNESYTKKNSGVNGQPSVIYGAKIGMNNTNQVNLEYLGTGSLEGSDGNIHQNAQGITTAKNIVKEIIVK